MKEISSNIIHLDGTLGDTVIASMASLTKVSQSSRTDFHTKTVIENEFS